MKDATMKVKREDMYHGHSSANDRNAPTSVIVTGRRISEIDYLRQISAALTGIWERLGADRNCFNLPGGFRLSMEADDTGAEPDITVKAPISGPCAAIVKHCRTECAMPEDLSESEVAECTEYACPLWPFRNGGYEELPGKESS